METFYALLALCVENSTVTGEFLSQRPVTRSFDVFFDLCLNKGLSKQWWDWWFETPSRSLWRHCDGVLLREGQYVGSVSMSWCLHAFIWPVWHWTRANIRSTSWGSACWANSNGILGDLCDDLYSLPRPKINIGWWATISHSDISLLLFKRTNYLIIKPCGIQWVPQTIGSSTVQRGSPSQRASYAESASMSWRHHAIIWTVYHWINANISSNLWRNVCCIWCDYFNCMIQSKWNQIIWINYNHDTIAIRSHITIYIYDSV